MAKTIPYSVYIVFELGERSFVCLSFMLFELHGNVYIVRFLLQLAKIVWSRDCLVGDNRKNIISCQCYDSSKAFIWHFHLSSLFRFFKHCGRHGFVFSMVGNFRRRVSGISIIWISIVTNKEKFSLSWNSNTNQLVSIRLVTNHFRSDMMPRTGQSAGAQTKHVINRKQTFDFK